MAPGTEHSTVDPAFFTVLQRQGDDIVRVDIRVKPGRHHNELTRYRYDVVLGKAPAQAISLEHAPSLHLGRRRGRSGRARRPRGTGAAARLRVVGVPNERVIQEFAAMQALDDSDTPHDRMPLFRGAPDLESLHEGGARIGYWVGVTGSVPAARERWTCCSSTR